MARLNRSDDTGANREGPGRLSIPQGRFRTQQDVVGDSLLQLGGRGEVEPGSGTVNDPLNAPFVLYVNPYTGRDDFAFGSYAEADDGSVDQELRRIESQRLECGYTEASPFRTINRAVIEAGLITSKSYFSAGTIPFQQVCIVLAPGTYTALCGQGLNDSDANFPDWADDEITDEWLTGFNPEALGGIILPRGCSMISLDLRKTIIRPIAAAVPDPADEAANYNNRRTILRMTGEGYYYGMTFMDADGVATSHHLMSCFEFASEAQLAEFYNKIERKFAGVADTNVTAVAERQTEFEIVGPQPAPGTQTQTTDTTASASPYIYNASIRSTLGLCGVFCNGAVVEGFRSCVIAQFTGVSLQNDFSVQNGGTCWQIYNEGTDTWGNLDDFATYRTANPDNVRMNANRRSFHIRAINRAVIQEVSVFAIGQGVHHWVESGGEITVTNSNSNFGGAAAIAEGHWDVTLPQDNNFPVERIKVPTDLSEKRNNIREITLGTTIAAQGGGAAVTSITLQEALTGDEDLRPDVLAQEGFSLAPGTQVWIENPEGNDFTARLDTDAWETAAPAVINVANAFATGTLAGAGGGAAPDANDLQDRRVYVRRLIDTRTTDERTYALILDRPANARTPLRDYIIQDQAGSIGAPELCAVQAPRRNNEVAGINGVQIMLRQQCPQQADNPNLDDVQQLRNYYRLGDTIRAQDKHWQATVEHYQTGNAPDLDNFAQQNVHTETANANTHNPEDYFKNATPIIIFDADLSTEINKRQVATAPIGIQLDASGNDDVWTTGGAWAVNNTTAAARNRLRNEVQAQYRTATDYRGLHTALTTIWSRTNAQAVEALEPQLETDRLTNPPSDQTVDFRRPSQIRLFGHAYEWAGYLNYTKALPQYQLELSRENKFTYYGTSKDGGRVYFSGFNEEGALVSPAGLTDITTGETVAPEDLDPIEPPCQFFDCLTVNELTVQNTLTTNGDVDINGSVDISDDLAVNGDIIVNGDIDLDNGEIINFAATTTRPGIGDLARVQDLRAAIDTPAAGNDAAINTAINAAGDDNGDGTDLVNAVGLGWALDQLPIPPILNDDTRRLFVSNDWTNLPANAAAYPIIGGGTRNLNNIPANQRFTTIRQAYQSLPFGFSLPDDSQIEIYLLDATHDEGVWNAANQVGSEDQQNPTWIMALNWNNNNAQQVVSYTVPGGPNFNDGYFRNVFFYSENAISGPNPVNARWRLDATVQEHTANGYTMTCVVGTNITTTNMHVRIIKNSNSTEAQTLFCFRGARCGPFGIPVRSTNRAIGLHIELTGNGTFTNVGDRNDVRSYNICVFEVAKDRDVSYGAAQIFSGVLPGTDAERRRATANFVFTNNSGAQRNILFHYIRDNSRLVVDGAISAGAVNCISWSLEGNAAWQYRLFGFNQTFFSLLGQNCPNGQGVFTQRGMNTEAWGGFRNQNNSTNWVNANYSPGPFSQFDCDDANWGVFGVHNGIAIADTLMGGTGSDYRLQPNAARFNIVTPS